LGTQPNAAALAAYRYPSFAGPLLAGRFGCGYEPRVEAVFQGVELIG
jgi:hypothetical protein